MGYDKASASIPADIDACADWLVNGIGRDIVVYSPHTDVMFECFVNKVSVSHGRMSLIIGPLLDVVNSADIAHSVLDTSTGSHVEGSLRISSLVFDSVSVGKLGTLYNRVNGGGAMTVAEADQVLNMYVQENKNPKTDHNLNFGSSEQLYLSIDMLGYSHMASRYSYTNTGTGTIAATAKIQAILAAHPGSIFSTSYSRMVSNPMLVKVNETGEAKALSLIHDVVRRGDSSYRPYVFGIYAGRKAVYRPVSTSTIDYTQHGFDSDRVIYNAQGDIVQPWDIEVGRILHSLDFLSSYSPLSRIRDEARSTLISKVSFSIPYDFNISGDVVKFLPQKLARMGLGGV